MKGPKAGIVKASFYTAPSPEESKLLKTQSCYLLVSVGQPYHEGDKLQASIDLINRKFQSCTILVADTLQRYNLEEYFHGQYSLAYEKSLLEGNEWISRNHPIFSSFTIPYQLIRWDHWLQHSQFKSAQEHFELEYQKNLSLEESFAVSINEFIERLKKRMDQNEDYFLSRKKYCSSYLKEECAAMLLWAKAGLGYEIYPTKRNEAMSATYETLIKSQYPLQLKQLALRFKRYHFATSPTSSLVDYANLQVAA